MAQRKRKELKEERRKQREEMDSFKKIRVIINQQQK
jgi:hypothetical protein